MNYTERLEKITETTSLLAKKIQATKDAEQKLLQELLRLDGEARLLKELIAEEE